MKRARVGSKIEQWRREMAPSLSEQQDYVHGCLMSGLPTFYGSLYIDVLHDDGNVDTYGLASLQVVTTLGARWLVDALQGLSIATELRYHGMGTGGGSPAVGDSALVSEVSTTITPTGLRASGVAGEGTSENVYRSIGVLRSQATQTITEHGLFTERPVGAGKLFDRSVFTGVPLTASTSIRFTYDLTISAGG